MNQIPFGKILYFSHVCSLPDVHHNMYDWVEREVERIVGKLVASELHFLWFELGILRPGREETKLDLSMVKTSEAFYFLRNDHTNSENTVKDAEKVHRTS